MDHQHTDNLMWFGQLVAETAGLLPDHSALVLVYAGCGGLGGIAAGCLRYVSQFPALSELVMRLIVGGTVGMAVGAACLARFGHADNAVWFTMFSAIVGGFSGPAAAFNLWTRITGNNNTGVGAGKTGDPK